MEFKEDISCLIEGKLYVGNHKAAANESLLNLLKVKAILNVTPSMEVSNFYEAKKEFVYKRIVMFDQPHPSIKLDNVFKEAIDFIEEHVQMGEAVFVHCLGVSFAQTTTFGIIRANTKHRNRG